MVRVVMDLEHILGTLCLGWEYTLDGMLGHRWALCTHIHT